MPKILAVDDSPASVGLLASFLEVVGGHKVASAHSGYEAKLRLAQQPFEVLVFDYLIADVNGLDLLRWARINGITTPCIIASAVDEGELGEIGRRAAAEGLGPVKALPKTPDATAILDEINKILRGPHGEA